MLVPLDMEIMVVMAHLDLLHTSLEVEVVPVVLDNLDLQDQVVGMVVQENKHLQSLGIHQIHMDTLDLQLVDSGLQVEEVVVHRLDLMEVVEVLVDLMLVQEMGHRTQQIMYHQLLQTIIVDLVVVVLVTYQVFLLLVVKVDQVS